jgi:hypothetical protein
MPIDINYWYAVPFFVLAIILIFWLIRRNLKDEKIVEKEIMQSEITPEKHDKNDAEERP